MIKRVYWATDQHYVNFTETSIVSFLKHNIGWTPIVYDVGMLPRQLERISKLAEVRPAKTSSPSHSEEWFWFVPTAYIRIKILTEIEADEIFLYLDGDTLTFGSIEETTNRFIDSGKAVGLLLEDDKRIVWPCVDMKRAWLPGCSVEFIRRDEWIKKPVYNTGIFFATHDAVTIGEKCLKHYAETEHYLRFGEQTLIDSIIYDNAIEVHELSVQEHCLLREKYIEHKNGFYVSPFIDGKPIMIRHFCGELKHREFIPNHSKFQEMLGLGTKQKKRFLTKPVIGKHI